MISHPGYFGKSGMRYFHKTLNKNYLPTINVSNLWSLVSEEVSAFRWYCFIWRLMQFLNSDYD